MGSTRLGFHGSMRAKRVRSFGKHSPVVWPMGVRVATQPYSSKISAPICVDEMRPMTKKDVLQSQLKHVAGMRDDSPLQCQDG